MAKRSKRYRAAAAKIERTRRYSLEEAVRNIAAGDGPAKFDETVELAAKLGVDPRQADQNVRGTVVLPHGTGKSVRVLVLAKGDKAREATEAGADHVGADDVIKRIQEEQWLEFDTAIATPDMMGAVGRLGKILGPRGLMPNPKVGTVTFDVGKAVRELKGGRVEFRVEKAGIVHARIGKVSFNEKALYVSELSDDVVDVIATHLPGKASPLSIMPIFPLGGVYARVPDDATAFGGPRTDGFLIGAVTIAPTPELHAADRAWVRALWSALVPHSANLGGYVNFMSDYEEDRVRASYGKVKYDRLAEIKARYDPYNVFQHNANIKPAHL